MRQPLGVAEVFKSSFDHTMKSSGVYATLSDLPTGVINAISAYVSALLLVMDGVES
jgi:hypothetical protein